MMPAIMASHGRIQGRVRRAMNRIRRTGGALLFLAVFAAPGVAQQVEGPVTPPPKFEAKPLPSTPTPEAPPVPAEEIISRFSHNEDLFKRAFDTYDYDQAVRVQETADNGSGGEFNVTGQLYMKPDGIRNERIMKTPVSTLKFTAFSVEDIKVLVDLPLFVLTTEELPHYTLTYRGREKLDELNTYIFLVKPKQVERRHRFFDGLVWVDDHDFAVVKSYGQFVTEVSKDKAQFPFTMYETYRENFQEKYWFPTYVRSEEVIPGPNNKQVRLRLVMRSTNFHAHSGTGTTATDATKPAPAKPPQSPQP
jgi:hypothetical protein